MVKSPKETPTEGSSLKTLDSKEETPHVKLGFHTAAGLRNGAEIRLPIRQAHHGLGPKLLVFWGVSRKIPQRRAFTWSSERARPVVVSPLRMFEDPT